MHEESIEKLVHDHTFGQDKRISAEKRTIIVIIITAITMVVEIGAGIFTGSMALLADGLHMGSHASALMITAFAYFYTRKHASDKRFNFGTGKVNSLSAFASAIMLAFFALVMVWECIRRLLNPENISFNQAILVAVIGLLVNFLCLFILGKDDHSDVGHSQETSAHDDVHGHGHDHSHGHGKSKDQNLLSAYLHVLADAMTSVFAILALLAGKYMHLRWFDPIVGILGAVLIFKWSFGLMRVSARILLDMQSPKKIREMITRVLEADGDTKISDLHVWAVGPGIYAAEVALVSSAPMDPERYAELIPHGSGIVHITFESRKCSCCPS